MALETAHNAALAQVVFTRFTAVQIALPEALGGTVNLLDGSGFVTFSHNGVATTFKGSHPVFGALAAPPDVTSSTANSSPRVDVILLPPSDTAISGISQPTAQGSRVYIYEGALNPQTGLVIGVPALLWSGRLDVAEITASERARSIRLDVASAFERLFEPTATGLNETWHKWIFSVSPSLLAANISAALPTPWGREGQKAQSRISPPTYGGGGTVTGGGSSGGGGGISGGGVHYDQRDVMLF